MSHVTTNLNELAAAVHKNAVDHGWLDKPRSTGDVIALIHSEASEVLEEHRNGHGPTELYFVDGKPEGQPSELADIIIRVLDYCGEYNIDIDFAVQVKHEYNKSRPYRHGGKVL